MTETDPNHKNNPIFINTTDKETKTYEFAKKNPIFVSSVTKLSSHPVLLPTVAAVVTSIDYRQCQKSASNVEDFFPSKTLQKLMKEGNVTCKSDRPLS